MNLLSLVLIAAGLSMDAFAISVCEGLTMYKFDVKKSFVIGLYFGFFQAVMPLAGYFAATRFAAQIVAYDHWTAFILLGFIGGKMIVSSFGKEKQSGGEFSLKPARMLALSVATSIDALAVGISFAFLQVDIVPAALIIGGVTFIFCAAGVKTGNIFGAKFKSKAEFAGGVILVLMGLKILLEHTGVM